MARYLWGTTSTSNELVRIYIDSELKGLMGETDTSGSETAVSLHPDVLEDALLLDETLMHEFVHVCELHFGEELLRKKPRGCTQAALVFGRELPRMLRQLKQTRVKASEV